MSRANAVHAVFHMLLSPWSSCTGGAYRPEKYQKMMEYWGGPISYEEYVSRMIQVILCGKKMYDYFK